MKKKVLKRDIEGKVGRRKTRGRGQEVGRARRRKEIGVAKRSIVEPGENSLFNIFPLSGRA